MSFFCPNLYSFYGYFILLSTILTKHFANGTPDCDKVKASGTGTVLFSPTDVYKTCWSQEEIAILTARIILEDAIPDPRMISVQCNEDIEDLIEYFKDVIETIRSNTRARKRHIMLLALTDLLGGFFHHAFLPMARKAYYYGAVDYVYMEKLIQFYEEIKWFLRTNGQGWTKPMTITKEVKVPLIEIEAHADKKENGTCCQKVLYYEHEPLKTRKRSVNIEKGVYFPLPFFDAKTKPTAIAIPLRHFALRNIESKRAAYAVMKYFISAELCLKEKNAKPEMFQKFQNSLYTWIEKDVVPKLDDDKFYSAFGGISRVQNTLRALGAKVGAKACNTDEGEEEVGAIPGVGCSSKRNKLLLIAMLVIIVAWFLIGTCFICYRMKNSKASPKSLPPDDAHGSRESRSTSSFSSSRWSSLLSRSSSKTDKEMICKCCESTISVRSTPGYTSTSDYDSEKLKKRDRKSSKTLRTTHRRGSQNHDAGNQQNDGPAIIDTNHSMKVLPSIAEISEQSRDKNGSLRKISFADESAMSSSDGGFKVCAPPWAQSKHTVPCPAYSDKSTNYDSSRSTTAKSQGIQDSFSDLPVASSTRTYDPSIAQKSSQFNQSNQSKTETMNSSRLGQTHPSQSGTMKIDKFGQPHSKYDMTPSNQFDEEDQSRNDSMKSDEPYNKRYVDEPEDLGEALANSTFRNNRSDTSNMSNIPLDPSTSKSIEKKSRMSSEQLSFEGEEVPRIKEEPKIEEETENREEPEIKQEKMERSYYNYAAACHSSMSGSYHLHHKPDPSKPYIFGYDFQTSTSSELSDDD